MRLKVVPIYGWGWFTENSPRACDVPTAFMLDAEEIPTSNGVKAYCGRASVQHHPLGGLWIALSQRHANGFSNDFNLRAYQIAEFPAKDIARMAELAHCISGYATVTIAEHNY